MPTKNNRYIVHIQLGNDEEFGETLVPVFAKSLDEAHDWADRTYGQHGIEVTRIRPDLKRPTME